MRKFIVFTVFTFILTSQSAIADFKSASDAYGSEDYTQAFQEFKELAILGNKRAQYNLAIMYLKGQGISKDITAAYAWFKLAQTENNPKYKKSLANTSKKLTADELKLADEKAELLLISYGSDQLITRLSPIASAGGDEEKKSVDRPKVEIVKHHPPKIPIKLRKIAHRGWVTVEFDINPDGTVHNSRIVDAYPDDAYNKSSIEAISKWLYKITYPEGVEPYPVAATQTINFAINDNGGEFKAIYAQRLEKIKHRAINENARAQYVYAIAANVGTYVDKENFIEQTEVNSWLLKSAQNGNIDAQYLLGKNIFYGKGCKTEKQKGLFWIAESASKGNDLAARMTYELLSSDMFINNSNKTADEWLKQSASAGNPDSMIKWAHFAAYDTNASDVDLTQAREFLKNGSKDRSKSVLWYQASAELYRRENKLDKARKDIKKANKLANKLGWDAISLNTEI